MPKSTAGFGSQLIGSPTGTLRTVLLVSPSASIETAKTLPGEPGTIFRWAAQQHEIFRKTLNYFGVETIVAAGHGSDSYETAAANGAVAFKDGAWIMRPTAMTRRAEADRTQAELSRLDVPIAGHIPAPGLLDGCDVMLAESTAFIGVGAGGNAFGRDSIAEAARAAGYRTVEVALAPGVPSLRAVASAVATDTIVIAPDKADVKAFDGFKLIELELGESLGAGVLCLGQRRVIADLRYRTSLGIMRRAGIAVESIDLYEYAKIGITPSMMALALKRD